MTESPIGRLHITVGLTTFLVALAWMAATRPGYLTLYGTTGAVSVPKLIVQCPRRYRRGRQLCTEM